MDHWCDRFHVSSPACAIQPKSVRLTEFSAKNGFMRNSLLRAVAALCTIAAGLQAQNLTGTWTGELTQGTGGTQPRFYYQMDLVQGANGSISGQSTIEVIGQPQYRGVMRLGGTFSGGILRFQEGTLLVNQPEPNTRWCIKLGDLTLSGDTLSGPWASFGCAPGNITVTRAVKSYFVPLPPCRLMDTREGQGFSGAFGPPTFEPLATREVPVTAGRCGVPNGATAYSLNVTVVPKGPLGFVTIWPSGRPQPVVSTLNAVHGGVLANAAIVPAGNLGSIQVFATDRTDIILDINGYFATSGGNEFFPLNPCRALDTRASTGFPPELGSPILSALDTRTLPITTACGVPQSATVFSLNATVVPPGPMGFLTLWPTGQTRPVVSTLNAVDGTVVANAALLSAGTGGRVSAFVSEPSHLLLDVNGYFRPTGAAVDGLAFYPVVPCRVADTRVVNNGAPRMNAQESRSFVVAGKCGVPATAKAYSVNATVVPTGQLGFLTLWPAGSTRPVVSTLNSLLGRVLANAAIVPAGANGQVSAFVTDATDVILDVNGYFQ